MQDSDTLRLILEIGSVDGLEILRAARRLYGESTKQNRFTSDIPTQPGVPVLKCSSATQSAKLWPNFGKWPRRKEHNKEAALWNEPHPLRGIAPLKVLSALTCCKCEVFW